MWRLNTSIFAGSWQAILFGTDLLVSSLCCLQSSVPWNSAVWSRVGDRPTATILHAQLHFFIFAWVFIAKYSSKIYPS